MKSNEISNEVKAKVFAMYYGQKVLTGETIRGEIKVDYCCMESIIKGINKSLTLILRTIDQLTDDEAKRVAEYIYKHTELTNKNQ